MRIAQQLNPTGAPPSSRLADQTSSAGVGSCERPHDAVLPRTWGHAFSMEGERLSGGSLGLS